jgi:hypothetical protein
VIVEAIHPGVIGLVEPDQQIWICRLGKISECFGQKLWPQLGSSTGAAHFGGQFDFGFSAFVIHTSKSTVNDEWSQLLLRLEAINACCSTIEQPFRVEGRAKTTE